MSEKKTGPSPRRVTQGDIARELGISRIAVSYALRRSKNVSTATHERVLEASARLGYRVNAGARAMRTGSSSNLGLIKSAGWATSVLPQALLSAILRVVNNRHMHLVVAQLEDGQLTDPAQLPVTIREHVVDGALVYYTHGAPQAIAKVFERVNLSVIWLNVHRPTGCVYYDEIAAGREVAARLIEAGCQKFIWLDSSRQGMDPDEIHYSKIDREKGFRDAIAEAGFDVVAVTEPPNGTPVTLPASLKPAKAPVGIFAYSATGVISAGLAGLQKGFSIGRDLHLATVAGALAHFGPNPVETVCLDYNGLAHASVALLVKQMESPGIHLHSVAVPPLPRGVMPGERTPAGSIDWR